MFKLHDVLARDGVEICQLDLCKVLLMKDANYPWLVLVPARPNLRDFHDVKSDEHATLMAEITKASTVLQDLYKAFKINVAALGNMVPQLHIHVIARYENDCAWPGPIWGVAPAKAYDPIQLETEIKRLQAAFQAS